jgi:Skp family chaperone for outer membrane proteins
LWERKYIYFSFDNEENVLKPMSAEKTKKYQQPPKSATEKEEKMPKYIAGKLDQQEQEEKHKQRAEILKQQDESPREPVYDENRNLDLLGKEKGAKN